MVNAAGAEAGFVFTHEEGPEAVLEGIGIRYGDAGIHCLNSSPSIRNCMIAGGLQWSVWMEGSNSSLTGCVVDSSTGGISLSFSDPAIEACTIADNDGNGVECYHASPVINRTAGILSSAAICTRKARSCFGPTLPAGRSSTPAG